MKIKNLHTTFESYMKRNTHWNNDSDVNSTVYKINKQRDMTNAKNWLSEQIKNLEEFENKSYPNSIFYRKNGKTLFEYNQNTKDFWCSGDKIWEILNKNYNLNDQEIKNLIKSVIEPSLNLTGIKPNLPYHL